MDQCIVILFMLMPVSYLHSLTIITVHTCALKHTDALNSTMFLMCSHHNTWFSFN